VGESTIPILPCRHLDDIVPFYSALGFALTYRQARPNPYAALRRGGLELHFFGLEEFDPEQSMGSAILLVPDTGALYDAFATGLRAAYGRLPVSGIPRITRPRRKQGGFGGFTVVDPGGNWLRVNSAVEDATEPPSRGMFERALQNAARQADSHGDEQAAIKVLEAGLLRHADAPAPDRIPVLVYLAELAIRTEDFARASAALADLEALSLTDAERTAATAELATAAELRAMLSATG
jgi:hypothetical protein